MHTYRAAEMMERGKTMTVLKRSCIGEHPGHTHDFVELVYILSGKAEHVVDGVKYSVSRGDIIFMNCNCVHSFSSESEHTYINILFTPEFIGEDIVTPENAFSLFSLTAFDQMRNDLEFGKITFSGQERQDVENIIQLMLTELDTRQTYWESTLRNCLNNLIIKMLRKTEQGMDFVEIDDMWKELSTYIDENLDTSLSLSELAKKCFYNPSYFSRIFKEKFGVSLVEYKTKRRIEKAIELLSDTELPIDEISDRVGFSDRHSFYHAFSKYADATPASYRAGRKSKKVR